MLFKAQNEHHWILYVLGTIVISAIERNRERIWVKLLYDSVSGSVAKFNRQINENSLLAELKRKAASISKKISFFC